MAKRIGCLEPERQKIEKDMIACMPSLKAFAISLTRDETRAEDLVQQTILQALLNFESFEPGTNLSAWLFTILRNRLRSDYRKHKREAEWDPEFEDALTFSTGLGDGGAEAKYDFNRLLLYLACLPVDQSDALIAVGYLGLSYDDAAERLSCAMGTVKSRVNRARNELASLMQGAILKNVRLGKLKTATDGVPKDHPYYLIAKAYEELYASCEDVSDSVTPHRQVSDNGSSTPEQLWHDLIASGAMDEMPEDLHSLMQGNEDR